MAATRTRRTKLSPKDEAAYFSSMIKDKDGFDIKYINSVKGRGVFSCRHFQKGDFLVEYRGDVITKQEYERRLRVYHRALEVFLFEFRFNGKQLWVDAAREDGSLGRLVNDDHMNPNSKMKTITVDRKPHLCLFAIKDISPGEEISYNYGDSDWPWRSKVTSETQQQSDALVSCIAEDGTEKISTSDAQLTLHDDVQQVTSETGEQSNALVSCAAEDGKEKISSETDPQLRLNDNAQQNCKHDVISSVVSSLDKCDSCSGPFSAYKWLGVRCKVCSCFWHKTCYNKKVKSNPDPLTSNSEEQFSSEDMPDQDYVPDSSSDSSEGSMRILQASRGYNPAGQNIQTTTNLQGKTLEEIEIEDTLDLTDSE
ncbi:hypothetical protein AMELA_G00146890 [Ameiurus melas]|uniref:SET domain-containing protein n=1 Tax=Ameiurus melas TaxID=219545 RepID=A0A7J6AGV7_AMEME|nr:hypothetical protein AMELA_G00146890 [Ameiurus melas]